MPRPYVPVSATHHRNMTQPARYAVINCGSRLERSPLGAQRVNVTISPALRATYVLHAQRGAVLFIPDADFNIACTTLISAFFRHTPIGAQGDPIPIHLIIIPQTIHISARCHLLPSSKENVKPHNVSLQATHHFFVLGFGLDCTAFI